VLVEHSFVTTLPFESVQEQAGWFLMELGFTVTTACWKCNADLTVNGVRQSTCPDCGASLVQQTAHGPSPRAAVIGVRGKETTFNVTRTDDLPQRVRLEFDRGRCLVAASIMEQKKVEMAHRQMVLALARGLEKLLVDGDSESGLSAFRQAQVYGEELDAKRRSTRMGCWIAVLVVLVLFVLLIVIAAITSGNRPRSYRGGVTPPSFAARLEGAPPPAPLGGGQPQPLRTSGGSGCGS
jgi:hypothetical protein